MGKHIPNKDLELEIRDILLNILYGQKRLLDSERLYVQESRSRGRARHNYQRDLENYKGVKEILVDGALLARVTRRPHKLIEVYPFYDHRMYVQKILERVAYNYAPDAKVVTIQGE